MWIYYCRHLVYRVKWLLRRTFHTRSRQATQIWIIVTCMQLSQSTNPLHLHLPTLLPQQTLHRKRRNHPSGLTRMVIREIDPLSQQSDSSKPLRSLSRSVHQGGLSSFWACCRLLLFLLLARSWRSSGSPPYPSLSLSPSSPPPPPPRAGLPCGIASSSWSPPPRSMMQRLTLATTPWSHEDISTLDI
jgi:hypothetical protein